MQQFVDCISGGESLYGFQRETLDSLVLTLLPPIDHKYSTIKKPLCTDSSPDETYLIKEMILVLRHAAGFQIPPVSEPLLC